MNVWLETLTGLMRDNLWFAPVLSLAAGVVTSFTPCSLSAVPMILAYVGAVSNSRKKALRLSLVMALGMAATFGVFGSIASAIGHAMHDVGRWWHVFLGILMVVMALQVWGVIHLIPGEEHDHSECEDPQHCEHHNRKLIRGTGYKGAFFTGALGGLFASHCATPVMLALLAMVVESGRGMWWGIFLMILYALGHSILLVAAGTSYGAVEEIMNRPGSRRVGKVLRTIVGVLIFAIGIGMFFVE